jgi:hypothetical protein
MSYVVEVFFFALIDFADLYRNTELELILETLISNVVFMFFFLF